MDTHSTYPNKDSYGLLSFAHESKPITCVLCCIEHAITEKLHMGVSEVYIVQHILVYVSEGVNVFTSCIHPEATVLVDINLNPLRTA